MRFFSRPFLILVSMFVTSAMAQPFLGLSLAPKLITVAEALPDGTSRAIAQVEGIGAYQAAIAAIARNEPHDLTHFNKALQKSLKLAQAATNTHFNRRVQIPVVSLPSTVHDRTVIAIVQEAMGSIGFSSQHEQLQIQTIEMSYAAHYAYGLGTAKGLGLDKMEVDWEMGSYEALLVDYNLGSLSFTLIDLAEHGCVIRGQVALPESGESAIAEEASTKDTAQKPIRTDSQTEAYHASIRQSLDSFLDQELLLTDNASNTGATWKPLRSDIHAVVLAGDASAAGFDGIKDILKETFSNLPARGWLKDEIEPRDMAAIGAAKRAKHLLGKPEDFDVHVQWISHDHDEL